KYCCLHQPQQEMTDPLYSFFRRQYPYCLKKVRKHSIDSIAEQGFRASSFHLWSYLPQYWQMVWISARVGKSAATRLRPRSKTQAGIASTSAVYLFQQANACLVTAPSFPMLFHHSWDDGYWQLPSIYCQRHQTAFLA